MTDKILESIENEVNVQEAIRQKAENRLRALKEAREKLGGQVAPQSWRKGMSAEKRADVSKRMKKYWAERRRAKSARAK